MRANTIGSSKPARPVREIERAKLTLPSGSFIDSRDQVRNYILRRRETLSPIGVHDYLPRGVPARDFPVAGESVVLRADPLNLRVQVLEGAGSEYLGLAFGWQNYVADQNQPEPQAVSFLLDHVVSFGARHHS
jgi:hypothetical protein